MLVVSHGKVRETVSAETDLRIETRFDLSASTLLTTASRETRKERVVFGHETVSSI